MSCILRYFWPIRQGCSSTQYSALPKKDDDFGIEQARIWQLANPVPNSQDYLSIKRADEIARAIIKDLGRGVPINSANASSIQEHLIAIAKTNDILRQKLIKRLADRFGNAADIKPVLVKLIMTVSIG